MDVIIPTTISTGSIIRASIASYFDNTGLMRYSPINTARLNYNPANLTQRPELLLEPVLTTSNISDSEGFTTNTTLTGATTYVNSAKAPDGTYTATQLVESTANSAHKIRVTSTVDVIGQPARVSFYAKANGRDKIVIRTLATSPADGAWLYDLGTQTVTVLQASSLSPTFNIQTINNGWYRVSLSGYSSTFDITLYNGAETYTGNGRSGVFLWGIMLENGNANTLPSTYTPTTATFVSGANPGRYVNSAGLLATATGTARMNYTPDNLTLAPKLLVEPAATNILRNTVSLNGPWVSTAAIATAQIAPTTANNEGIRLTDSSNSVLQGATQPITVANDSAVYTLSVWIEKTVGATTFPSIQMAFSGGTGINSALALETNTGVITPVATGQTFASDLPISSKVVSYPNFWRVSLTYANNSSGNTTMTIGLYPAASTTTGGIDNWDSAVQGNKVFYGMQVETGFTESSYIANLTTATTRTADVVTRAAATRAAESFTNGLLASTIPENDFPLYNPATAYGVDVAGNNSVIYNHVKYASLQAANTGHQPDISPTWWSVIGPTNLYAMIDAQVGTQTIGPSGGHIITYIGYTASADMSFINVSADSVTVSIYSNGVQQYQTSLDFTGGSSGVPITDWTLTGLPTYSNSFVCIDVYKASGAPAIGNFVIGTKYFLGSTETSPTIGITDYSIKAVDSFGNPTLTVRGYAKRMNTKQLLDDADVDTIARIMAQVRAKACVWNANTTFVDRTSNKKTSLIIYGYYKDWEIDVAYSSKSYLTATIEGLL